MPEGEAMFGTETVSDWEHGLLYRDGRFARVLPSGRHLVLGMARRQVVRLQRSNTVVTPAHEGLTSDGFPLRAAAFGQYEITDPKLAFDRQSQQLAPQVLASSLAAVVAARTLDALVEDRAALGEAALAAVIDALPGARFITVLVTSLVFPPEVRRMLTEAERARREGLAALERARAEQASLRALANAARLLKNSPELMNLRLLQSVGAKGATLVLGESGLAKLSGGLNTVQDGSATAADG